MMMLLTANLNLGIDWSSVLTVEEEEEVDVSETRAWRKLFCRLCQSIYSVNDSVSIETLS